jgi:hypothetical protein
MLMRPCTTRAGSRAVLVSLFLAALLLLTPDARAERLESPLELMYAPDALIIAGKLIETNPAGRIVIEPKDRLWGKTKPPAQVDIRVPKPVLDNVKIGERYIVAYSMVRRDPRKAVGMVANKDGAVAIVSPGIEPALFRDTPEVRAILKAGRSEHGRESRRLFDLLIAAIDGSDPALQNLAAGEFVYEPELAKRFRDADRARLEKIARSVKTPANVRAMLIEGASRRSKDLGDWWKDASLDLVTTTSSDGYTRSDTDGQVVALILTAIDVLDRSAIAIPPDALARWVRSPSPPLVERACVMLRRLGADKERSAIDQALADPALAPATRRFLDERLRRLDLIDKRKRMRKEGTARS